MVHALEQVKSLLKPNGRLIDIHPVRDWLQINVQQGKSVLLSESKAMTYSEDVRQADLALDRVLKLGVYARERTEVFDFFTYADSVDEMIQFWAELSPYDDTEGAEVLFDKPAQQSRFEQQMAETDQSQMVLHERVHIARLRPL